MSTYTNPFVHDAASILPDYLIKNMFIDNEHFRMLNTQKNMFFTGYRGSGKSMLLKYNSFKIQYDINKDDKAYDPFKMIGVYIPCNTPLFKKLEYTLLNNEFKISIIAEHILVSSIALGFINTFYEFDGEILEQEDLDIIAEEVSMYFGIECRKSKDVLKNIRKMIKKNLATTQVQLNNDPEAFYKDARTFSSLIVPLIDSFKEAPSFKNTHFMLMIDDAQMLSENQMSSLNTWISFRDTSSISFKLAITSKYDYKYYTNTSSVILENHDFITVDLQKNLFAGSSEFVNFAKRIIERRLEFFNFRGISADDFFPESDKFAKEIEQIREKFIRGDYDELKEKDEAYRRKNASKYVRAIYYRTRSIKSNIPRLPLTGFRVLSNLSTGVIRNLLFPCFKMFEKQMNKNENFLSIDHKIQYETIHEISNNLWEDVSILPVKIKDCTEEDAKKLTNFLTNFSEKLKQKLMDPNDREKQMLSFTITDLDKSEFKDEIQRVFHFALEDGLMYVRFGPDKSGGRTAWYTPNRIFWPIKSLDPVGQNGRMNILAKEVHLMMKNEKYLQSMNPEQLDMFNE